jgi:hypothetical protein
VTVYPKEYFQPLYWDSPKQDKVTKNTYTEHHYGASWHDEKARELLRAQRKSVKSDANNSVELEHLRSENIRLNAELSSFLGIKRSARLLLGNIMRRIKSPTSH